MAKGCTGRRRVSSRRYRHTPYPLPSSTLAVTEDMYRKSCSKASDMKEWEDATCSVCMECPHNAVLLLCSSHEKGCRPYMCGTSDRFSNCLDQYKEAYSKVVPQADGLTEKSAATELACPLCRGQVKGWVVVDRAREYLNAKKRSCMQDGCAFTGTYREMKKHVKAMHPSDRPRKVDPTLEQKWRTLESDRERADVLSTIRTSTPGAMVWGDYVIEIPNEDEDEDEEGGRFGVELDFLLLFANFGRVANGGSGNQPTPGEIAAGMHGNSRIVFESSDEDDDDVGYVNDNDVRSVVPLMHAHSHGGELTGRRGRRRRARRQRQTQIDVDGDGGW